MSADNWDTCPKCLLNATGAMEKAEKEVYDQYGQIPVEKFDKLRQELGEIDPEDYLTFREDYEIYGAKEGTLVVDYSGGCTVCGLKTALKYNHPFWKAK